MSDQTEQGNLFETKLSPVSQKAIMDSVIGLTEWGTKETQPHIRQVILDYYNQLVDLYKKHGDYTPNEG